MTAVAYFEPAFLLAAQRAFISSESLFRPAAVSTPFFRLEAFGFPPAFLLAAQRAFISWESFLRPAPLARRTHHVRAGRADLDHARRAYEGCVQVLKLDPASVSCV